jgi:hypothetical protein
VNAYEVDVLPAPQFSLLLAEQSPQVDWERWESILRKSVAHWEIAVLSEIESVGDEQTHWPDCIHDALAVAGKAMSHLGEQRQSALTDFCNWLFKELKVDADNFTGMSYLRGGQADFDSRGWSWFVELLNRNQRAFDAPLNSRISSIQTQYESTVNELLSDRTQFEQLDAAIDRVVWQLVGLSSNGEIPTDKNLCKM